MITLITGLSVGLFLLLSLLILFAVFRFSWMQALSMEDKEVQGSVGLFQEGNACISGEQVEGQSFLRIKARPCGKPVSCPCWDTAGTLPLAGMVSEKAEGGQPL